MLCLSRGQSYGTVLVQGFNPRKFRGMTDISDRVETEIMMRSPIEIHGKLPNHINASTRLSLIRATVWRLEHFPSIAFQLNEQAVLLPFEGRMKLHEVIEKKRR